MISSKQEESLEVWLDENLLLPVCRPSPFLVHLSPPDVKPELEFWNLLRTEL